MFLDSEFFPLLISQNKDVYVVHNWNFLDSLRTVKDLTISTSIMGSAQHATPIADLEMSRIADLPW